MACVYIPVQNSEEEVRVSLDKLPGDAADILDILKAEQAPLDLWLTIAREYFKQGKIDQFRQILEEGSCPESDEYYEDVGYERIAILNALGAYYCHLGKIEAKKNSKDECFVRATQYYNKSSRIDIHEASTWVGKGQLLLSKGEVEQASSAFKIVLDEDPDNVAALLGQACVHFNLGRFSESLKLYKRVLLVSPQSPAVVRLGIGLCQYELGRFEKAKKAFERVLQLDKDNAEALVALAVMDLQKKDDEASFKLGMEKMKRAFDIDPYCALSLNHLADYVFVTGKRELARVLSETAAVSTSRSQIKAHSYYNLARFYHDMGEFKKAKMYYMQSVKESKTPREFALPYYGLGQVQLKSGDLKSALASFEKIMEVHPDDCDTLKSIGHIYIQLGQAEKAQDFIRKATKVDPRDFQAFLDLGELLLPNDAGSALDAFTKARDLLQKRKVGKKDNVDDEETEVPVELLNNIGVLHLERGEFELAEQAFKDALGDGIWLRFLDPSLKASNGEELSSLNPSLKSEQYPIDASASLHLYNDLSMFDRLSGQGIPVELPFNKVSTLFNLARLSEKQHQIETASVLYRLILYKYPNYTDARLRLAAIAKARNNVSASTELISEALKVDEKCDDALLMRGDLELKNGDQWIKSKETFRAAKEMSSTEDGDDSYASLCLGNWNYFAAVRAEKTDREVEAAHLFKAKELYTNVLLQKQHKSNLYAANGAGIVSAEKGEFDVSKELFTQVQESAGAQMPDVWINLAHVHFAQGKFPLAVKMYQNYLSKFNCNTDSQVLHYLARTQYGAEQWQDCKKTMLRAVHLAPSDYTLKFCTGVALQRFSESTLKKPKKTVEEVRETVADLTNAVRLFGLVSAASKHHLHGLDQRKIESHCKKLLEAAKVELKEKQLNEEKELKQKNLADQQLQLAMEKQRKLKKVEDERKTEMEKRRVEDELKRLREEDEDLKRKREQWKSSCVGRKRKDRPETGDEEGGHGKRREREGKRSKRDKGQ